MKENGALSSLGVGLCVFPDIGVKVTINQNSILWNDVVHVHIVLGFFLFNVCGL